MDRIDGTAKKKMRPFETSTTETMQPRGQLVTITFFGVVRVHGVDVFLQTHDVARLRGSIFHVKKQLSSAYEFHTRTTAPDAMLESPGMQNIIQYLMGALLANADCRNNVLFVLQLLPRPLVQVELAAAEHVVQQALRAKALLIINHPLPLPQQ
jgi:hypothetical protein